MMGRHDREDNLMHARICGLSHFFKLFHLAEQGLDVLARPLDRL